MEASTFFEFQSVKLIQIENPSLNYCSCLDFFCFYKLMFVFILLCA